MPRLLLLLVPAVVACAVVWSARPHAVAADKVPARFDKDGVAFLETHCLHCHNDKTRKADVALHTFTSDESLIKDRKLWQKVVNAVKSGEMPPETRKRPLASEIETFLGIVQEVFARADKNAKPDPGRVTIRRLNRVEYNNTIRDLVGVDFNPAEDFPSDDIGHGFDNIGDVLTLSPVLMERYLAAAESIVHRAVLATLPKPTSRHMAGRYLEPGQDKDLKWRPLDRRGNQLHTPFKVTLAGDFVFRFRCYAKQTDAEPVKVAVFVGDRQLTTFDVTAPEKKPVTLEAKIALPVGEQRIFVKLLNPNAEKDKEGRTLFVESFVLNGPSDMRPETHRRLLASTGKTKDEQTREVISRFASNAFRRPATKDEVDRLIKIVEAGQKRGDTWEGSLQLAMQAVLVSPKFIFRVELDDRPQEAKPHGIDEYHLASRLSYFLWSSMPDQELFDLAAKKELSKNLDAQVRRMLKDAKAAALTENFAMQWLQLRRLKTFTPDPKLFPTFTDALRDAMLKETELFFAEVVREDRSILDLIDGRFTYLNEPLARHYGMSDKLTARPGKGGFRGFRERSRQFTRVELPEGHDRAGILAHASVLTVTSNPTRTSPVKRGRWILEQILGTPPPPAPPDVPELAEGDKAELTGSLRQRMEQHRKNPSCANCHARMDPIGFAFEQYDAIGKWRTKDGKFDIDPSGTLPDGNSFKGPSELKKILKEKKDLFARNLVEKLLTYALGRGLEHYDRPAVDAILAALAKNEYKFSVLAAEISKSFPFRMRRGKELSQ